MQGVAEELTSLKSKGAYRRLTRPSGLDFSSNDYLGLADHPSMRAKLAAYIANGHPVSSPSSRLLRGNLPIHEEVEGFLARENYAESALLFTSGYMANLGVVTTLGNNGTTTFFSDALNHASLVDAMKLSGAARSVFPHNDMAALETELKSSTSLRKVIVTERLFSMEGDFANVHRIAELAKAYGAWIYLDESHATGLFDPSMKILATGNELPLISMHTGGKALGAGGAFVCSSHKFREFLINKARPFIFTTALSPLLAVQMRFAYETIHENPSLVATCLRNASLFRLKLGLEDTPSPIAPIIVGGNDRSQKAASDLQTQGFDIRAIRAPSVPVGSERLRISIRATHTEEELCLVSEAIKRITNA